jgi:predicted LPLAT superfamily acyltransferase
MGMREKEELERIQKDDIRSDGIRVIGVERSRGQPAGILEGLRHLRRGGFVSMAGDVAWGADQRTVTAAFLGRNVRIPEAPFALALVSGAPLLAFFAFRTPTGRYRFTTLPPIHVTASQRAKRAPAIQQAGQRYLQYLEEALHRHPFQWYHFDVFLER